MFTDITHRDPDRAFEDAIASGFFSADPTDLHYAGHFMYMHTGYQGDAFKNIDTRYYVYTRPDDADYPEDRPRDDDCVACRR